MKLGSTNRWVGHSTHTRILYNHTQIDYKRTWLVASSWLFVEYMTFTNVIHFWVSLVTTNTKDHVLKQLLHYSIELDSPYTLVSTYPFNTSMNTSTSTCTVALVCVGRIIWEIK